MAGRCRLAEDAGIGALSDETAERSRSLLPVLHPPFRPLGASTNGRLEKTPLSSDATAMESAVLVVVSLTGRPMCWRRDGVG